MLWDVIAPNCLKPNVMNRRTFIALSTVLCATRSWIARSAPSGSKPKVGLCNFSCKTQWQAIREGRADAAFSGAKTFYDYSRKLGGDGVQTSVRKLSSADAYSIRDHVEKTGGYFEGDVRFPKKESDLPLVEAELTRVRETGAKVARVVLMGGRRYEVFKSLDEFKTFHRDSIRRLELTEPLARKHRVKLAIENHKDLLVDEQLKVLKRFDSEWLGVLVDTGNNIAMCEEPYEVIDALAPYVLSVHLKDMTVQPSDAGFLLSEVPFGTGFLDLERIVRTLAKSNPSADFHVEMATRDPLSVPCKTDGYWRVFPRRRESDLKRTLSMVASHPPKQPPPKVSGLSFEEILIEEALNNGASLNWANRYV